MDSEDDGYSVCSEKCKIQYPPWDQNTYLGRCRYFAAITNPFNLLKTDDELFKAKAIVDNYKMGIPLRGLTNKQFYRAKVLVDSAFHPDSGEKMTLFGRMSAQIPMNMLITGLMLAFCKSLYSIIFWQWFNQSFNALVNYTNRSGTGYIPRRQLIIAYVCATCGAVFTAVALNHLVAPKLPPVYQRLIPLFAVVTANGVNICVMRYKELKEGIVVYEENGYELGFSRRAAYRAIGAVLLSRIFICFPGMTSLPFLMEAIEDSEIIRKYPLIPAFMHVLLFGLSLVITVPMGCALFPQTYPIPVSRLESDLQEMARMKFNPAPSEVYCNKGL